jgi:hypothetical protein
MLFSKNNSLKMIENEGKYFLNNQECSTSEMESSKLNN